MKVVKLCVRSTGATPTLVLVKVKPDSGAVVTYLVKETGLLLYHGSLLNGFKGKHTVRI